MTSRLYPRLITIRRAAAQVDEGPLAYGGRARPQGLAYNDDATLIAEDVPASIQARDGGRMNPVGLPADGQMATWRILTPKAAVADGQVCNGDLITDDLGRRFAVTSDYTNLLGGRFTCDRLEA